MSARLILIRGDERSEQETTATTGLELLGDDRSIVAMRRNGELQDLAREITDGDEIEPIAIDSADGLDILRHSAAHVTAQAVQRLHADAKLGIGPPIRDGYYYDIDIAEPFTPEHLAAIGKEAARIVKERQRFVRREVSDADARLELADEPHKLELIDLKSTASADDGSAVEVGEGGLTIYDNVSRDGSVAWKDLCRGPHVPNTGYLGNGFAVTRSSAAYWRGNQDNAQLQRVYGTAWPSKEELKAYQDRLAEAARRDHRKLGAELDLFSISEDIGPGLVLWHPKGGMLRKTMEDDIRRRHEQAGFEYVFTPNIAKESLFHTSGHLPYYADTMFGPMDAENVSYRLKAMSCPLHHTIFGARGRSYRELPVRYFELGGVYRFEKSGVVQGLMRVRGITQDDSHTYVRPDQLADELAYQLRFLLELLTDYGLNDFYLELSTRGDNTEKFIGSDEQWQSATEVLRQVGAESGLTLVDDPGGAAFYGPKISVQASDALGRTWQLSTLQVDFNMPERFDLSYASADGGHERPVIIHTAKFGSLERFIGILIEHYAGAFPAWLAPVQVIGVPVAEEFDEYLQGIADQLRAVGVRVEIDTSDDRMPKKIRNATKQKVPFILIAGGEDRDAGAVSFRFRDGTQRNGVPVAEAIEEITTAIAERRQV